MFTKHTNEESLRLKQPSFIISVFACIFIGYEELLDMLESLSLKIFFNYVDNIIFLPSHSLPLIAQIHYNHSFIDHHMYICSTTCTATSLTARQMASGSLCIAIYYLGVNS